MEKIAKVFDSCDKDGDGKLNRDELKKAMSGEGFSEEEISKAMELFDMNGDGAVSKDELELVLFAVMVMGIFNQFDKDGSGELDKSEIDNLKAELGKCGLDTSKIDTFMGEDGSKDKLSIGEFMTFIVSAQ